MRVGERIFAPRLGPTLLLVLPALVCLGLGVWQLERAEQKRSETQRASQHSATPALEIRDLVSDPQQLKYRQVQVEGFFEPQRQLFIEGRREGGRSGLHLITPLRLADSEVRVLVNRGWIPDPGRDSLPEVPAPAGKVRIKGEVSIPSPPALVLHEVKDGFTLWGDRWPYLTVALFEAGAPYPVQPFLILLDPEDPNGFQRHWPKDFPKEGMHLGYAIQWFAFALIALVIFARLSLRPAASQPDD